MRSTLVVALFFLSPVIFSHLPKLLGIPYSFSDFGNFEEPKRMFVWLLSALLLPFGVLSRFRHHDPNLHHLQRYSVFALFLGVSIMQSLFYGTGMKIAFTDSLEVFGPIFWLTFLLLGNEIFRLPPKDLRLARYAMLASLLPIGAYAVAQALWFDPLSYTATFGENRVFSMLGNPNSLAGFCILLLPLLHGKSFRPGNALRICITSAILIILLLTHSFSGILLGFSYLLWISGIGKNIPTAWKMLVFIVMLFGICFFGFYMFPEYAHEKYLSIATRMALFANGIFAIVRHPEILVFGADQKNLLFFLNMESMPIIRQYVSPEIIIPSSHFFPLDIVLNNGILPYAALFLLYVSTRNSQALRDIPFAPILLFLAFFSIHAPSVIHLLLLTLSISSLEARDTNKTA